MVDHCTRLRDTFCRSNAGIQGRGFFKTHSKDDELVKSEGMWWDLRASDSVGLRGGRGLKFEKLKPSLSHASQGVPVLHSYHLPGFSATDTFSLGSPIPCLLWVASFKSLITFDEAPTRLSRIPPCRSKKPPSAPIPRPTPFSHKLVAAVHGMTVIYYLLGAALDTCLENSIRRRF